MVIWRLVYQNCFPDLVHETLHCESITNISSRKVPNKLLNDDCWFRHKSSINNLDFPALSIKFLDPLIFFFAAGR